jgi:dual specificity MAP kinase phosphatase
VHRAEGGYPEVIQLEETTLIPEEEEKRVRGLEGKRGVGGKVGGAARKGGVKKKSKKMGKTAGTQKRKGKGKSQTDPNVPPLLTCTFRPKELLRRKRVAASSSSTGGQQSQEVWEFVPARADDRIFLRNFGIQMVCVVLFICVWGFR